MDKQNLVHVIDDDEFMRSSLNLVLEIEGFVVRTYASANEFLRSSPPSGEGCVLTDLQMPGLSGIDLLAEIAQRGLGWPVIVMTALGTDGLRELLSSLGAFDLLRKPFHSETLIDAVRNALDSRYAA